METKRYYTIKMEGRAPVTLTYRVLAESPEEALNLIKIGSFSENPQIQLNRFQKIRGMVYLAGTSMLKFTKRFL